MRVERPHFKMDIDGGLRELMAFYLVFSWFMMPLFIFMTGFFSKSLYSKDGNFRTSKVVTFFVLFIVMDIMVYISNCITEGRLIGYHPYFMYKAQWFLFACGIWFLAIPMFRKMPAKVMIPLSFLIGTVGGYTSFGAFLSTSKLFAFFPFFVIGYYMTRKNVEHFLRAKTVFRIIALSVFILLFIVTLLFRKGFLIYIEPILEAVRPYWVMYDKAIFDGMAVPPLGLQWLIRIGWYVGVLITSALFMLIVPTKKTFWSKFGSRTLQIYIWHAILVRLLKITPVYAWIAAPSRGVVELIVLAVVIICSFALAFKPLGIPFDFISKLVAKIPDRKIRRV
jgi:fucose 4-O-acetylase-like acetyltransferase